MLFNYIKYKRQYLNSYTCMQELTQSVVRTEHSYIDNISMKDQKESDYTQKIQELKHILKWIHKTSTTNCLPEHQSSKRPASDYSYFMIKLESLNSIVFKKCYSHSKVYITLIANLVNVKTNRQFPKVTRIVKILEEASTYTYDLKQPLLFYFYTSCQSDIVLKIEVILSQQELKNQSSVPVFGSSQNCGTIQLDFLKERKSKEKKFLILPNEFSFSTKELTEGNIYSTSYANVLVSKSENYKYLEKIIPQNTLCDSTDRIAGIMGYFLPLSENALTDFALTPDAQGLQINFSSVQLSSNILREATAKAQIIVKNKFSLISKVSSNIGDIILQVKFHNGWKTISESSSILKEKGDIHIKTNQSNFSDFQNIQNNIKTQTKKGYESPIKIKNQNKSYSCENSIELKLVFPQEDECVIIYQIVADVTVRGEIENSQKKELPDLIQQNVVIPICFGVNSAKSIGNYRSLTCNLNIGGCLTTFQSLKQSIQQKFKQITLQKKSQASKGAIQSKNRIPSIMIDIDVLSNNNKTLKTLDNISQLSWKMQKNEIGLLDFEMHLIEKEQIPFHLQENKSYPFENNFSSLNVSKIDIKDKIQHQKERIAKQSKKNVIVKANKLDIDFNKEILISQHQRQQIYKTISPKENSYYTKQAFLKLLKQQLNKNYSKSININLQYSTPPFKSNLPLKRSNYEQEQTLNTLYNLQMSKLQPISIIEHKFSKYFYYLFSNRILHQKYYFKHETLSLDMIKTQLSEVGYNNCYFINFIEVNNHINNAIIKFPKIFYFKLRFYNHEDIRSELMTINKDTGEILLFNNENSTSKIMHIQVNIDDQPNNFLLKFVQFINYLHNGLLNVDIIDYFTGLSFGIFTIPLRNLIRRRRNEVIFIHEDLIYHKNMVRANMKVQLRAIRKMRHKNKVVQSPQKIKQSPIKKDVSPKKEAQTDFRLDRIQRFKQNRNKNTENQVQSQLKPESSQIAKIVGKAYIHERTKIIVSYLQKEFFFIEVSNKHDSNITYRVSIYDEDKKWIEKNSLSGQDELTIVKDPAHIEKQDYQIITASKKNQQKMLKCFVVNEDEQLEMNAKSKGFLLLCYLTVRRYKQQSENSNNKQLIIFNRQRTINCSFINETNGSIEVINAIDIVPTPQESTVQLEYYRPAQEQSLIHLPFIDSQYISAKIDQILIDDPYIIVLPTVNSSMPQIKRFTSSSNGIYLQISNDLPNQSFKEFNVLVLNDVKKKQMILGESRKNERSRSRIKAQSRYVPQVPQEIGGPELIHFVVRVWGCVKISVQAPLWGQKQGTFELNNQIFKNKNISHFYLVSDNERTLRLEQDKKHKYENLQLFKVNQANTKTEVNYSVFSETPNGSYVYIHAIDGDRAIQQMESLKTKEFKYVEPFYRLVLQIQTFIPNLKEMLKINVNKASQGILEEPFTYKSNCNKKTQFKIYSSDASLVWVKNNDSVFHIEAKAQKKLHINFNTQKIIELSMLTGVCESIVLGVKWDKGIDYYGFKFNIY